ncbi:MAG: hypothetical protein O2942_00150 [Proteobacteria bacterium]|nr:hypothetical protein [Pseudomonadota bacterium]
MSYMAYQNTKNNIIKMNQIYSEYQKLNQEVNTALESGDLSDEEIEKLSDLISRFNKRD